MFPAPLGMYVEEGLCRCFRRDQHLVGGGLKTGSNGPFVTKCGQWREQDGLAFVCKIFRENGPFVTKCGQWRAEDGLQWPVRHQMWAVPEPEG